MTCIRSGSAILCFRDVDFNCPFCGKEYSDADDKYLERCNRNKTGITTKTCLCGNRFGICYDYKGNMVSFELKTL